jgi:hypothetical protein
MHFLATRCSGRDATAATLINQYAKRWTIEPQFRVSTR